MKKKSFKVDVEIPEGVSSLDVQRYIKTAVARWQHGNGPGYRYVGDKVAVQPIGEKTSKVISSADVRDLTDGSL